MADLCLKLDAIEEGDGSVLDHSLVMYGGSMHGSDHNGNTLPLLTIGGAGGAFKTDQHVVFGATPGDRPLRDLYLTIMNGYFGMGVQSFGENVLGKEHGMISEILV